MVQFDGIPTRFRHCAVIYRAAMKTEVLVTVQNSNQPALLGDLMISHVTHSILLVSLGT